MGKKDIQKSKYNFNYFKLILKIKIFLLEKFFVLVFFLNVLKPTQVDW